MPARKKRDMTITRTLYSLADPLIRLLPGASRREKETLFSSLIFLVVFVVYGLGLPAKALGYGGIAGIILSVLLLVVIPLIVVLHAAELYDAYVTRRKREKETKENEENGENNDAEHPSPQH